MAIFGVNREINSNIERKEESSIVPHYESDAVDTRLVATVAGQAWPVTYFHRLVDDNMSVTAYDPNLNITLQDYNRIDDFIIKVNSAIPVGTPDGMSGDGIIDVNFVPNPNDLFLVKSPDGRVFIYVINSISRINYNESYLFKIEYNIQSEITNPNDPILTKLMGATTNEFVYNKDFRINDDKPVYSKAEFDVRERYLLYIETLMNDWTDNFIVQDNKSYMSYKVNENIIFDSNMEAFIKSTIGTSNLPSMVNFLSLDADVSILDTFLRNDVVFNRIKQYTLLNNIGSYGNNPYLFTISYTGINKILTLTSIEDDTKVSNNETVNELFPKVDNKFYIFREYIYLVLRGSDITLFNDNLTTFEKMVLTIVTGNILVDADIELIYKNIMQLDEQERFYFMPIFAYMLRYTLEVHTVEFISSRS